MDRVVSPPSFWHTVVKISYFGWGSRNSYFSRYVPPCLLRVCERFLLGLENMDLLIFRCDFIIISKVVAFATVHRCMKFPPKVSADVIHLARQQA